MIDPEYLTVLLFPLCWWFLNRLYGKIYGRRLKWYYSWASHGALLFQIRCPDWEVGHVAGQAAPLHLIHQRNGLRLVSAPRKQPDGPPGGDGLG